MATPLSIFFPSSAAHHPVGHHALAVTHHAHAHIHGSAGAAPSQMPHHPVRCSRQAQHPAAHKMRMTPDAAQGLRLPFDWNSGRHRGEAPEFSPAGAI